MIDPRRPGQYERLYTQLEGLIRGKSPNLIAGMATMFDEDDVAPLQKIVELL